MGLETNSGAVSVVEKGNGDRDATKATHAQTTRRPRSTAPLGNKDNPRTCYTPHWRDEHGVCEGEKQLGKQHENLTPHDVREEWESGLLSKYCRL